MRCTSLLLPAALTLLLASPARAAIDVQTVYDMVLQQQTQIAQLTSELQAVRAELAGTRQSMQVTTEQLADTRQQVKRAEEQLDLTASYLEQTGTGRDEPRLTLGAYGEMHYNNVDADAADRDFKELDFHRFVTFMNYEFSDRIRFYSEVEIEHSLVEDTDDGSGSGELEIEQAFLEYDLNANHYARTGLFLLPVGILNETHEPDTFYGVERNEVESIIIPTSWWEGGAGLGGRYGNGLSWDFALHSGLQMPTTGDDSYRVRSGRQKVSEANAEELAYTLRLRYTGVPGLELSGSYQHQQDASQLSGDGLDEGTLLSAHAIFQRGPFSLRALWAEWDFDGEGVALAGADQQTGWYVEPSLKFNFATGDWGFYTRYQDVKGARSQDRFQQWEAGMNYWPTQKVVLKLDVRDREHDLGAAADRDFTALDLGIGYQF